MPDPNGGVEELFIFEMRPGEDDRPPDDPDYMEGFYYVLNEDYETVFGPFESEAAAKFDARGKLTKQRSN